MGKSKKMPMTYEQVEEMFKVDEEILSERKQVTSDLNSDYLPKDFQKSAEEMMKETVDSRLSLFKTLFNSLEENEDDVRDEELSEKSDKYNKEDDDDDDDDDDVDDKKIKKPKEDNATNESITALADNLILLERKLDLKEGVSAKSNQYDKIQRQLDRVNENVNELSRKLVIMEASKGMSEYQSEEFANIIEELDMDSENYNESKFTSKLETIRDKLLSKKGATKSKSGADNFNESVDYDRGESNVMKAYVKELTM